MLNSTSNEQTKVLEVLNRGELAIIIDDASNPKRAALCCSAQKITTHVVNQILNLSGGHLFVALSPERVGAFMLNQMARPQSLSIRSTNQLMKVCLSVEAREFISTGISASDRARTISILGEGQPLARKLVQPGHIFPVEACAGGVLVANSLPEAALDLVKMANLSEAALFVDLLDSRGELIELESAEYKAKFQSFPTIKISEIVKLRLERETLIERIAEAKLPTRTAGELRSIAYKSRVYHGEHLALVKGDPSRSADCLVRVQMESTFHDVFGGSNLDSRTQISRSLQAISRAESGVLLYLRRPKPGYLSSQIENNQNQSNPQFISLMREHGIGSQILRDLGVSNIRLLTSSVREYQGIDSFGLKIISQEPLLS